MSDGELTRESSTTPHVIQEALGSIPADRVEQEATAVTVEEELARVEHDSVLASMMSVSRISIDSRATETVPSDAVRYSVASDSEVARTYRQIESRRKCIDEAQKRQDINLDFLMQLPEFMRSLGPASSPSSSSSSNGCS
eukprot:ANDGO_08632.mRNA.1 hypothetical protein